MDCVREPSELQSALPVKCLAIPRKKLIAYIEIYVAHNKLCEVQCLKLH